MVPQEVDHCQTEWVICSAVEKITRVEHPPPVTYVLGAYKEFPVLDDVDGPVLA